MSKIEIPYTNGLILNIPSPERDEDIFGYNIKKKKEQMWNMGIIPKFHLMSSQEKDSYQETELMRFAKGAHFMNNGKIEYLSPVHYMFLRHWDLGGGTYPNFIQAQQYLGWFMHLCRIDDRCAGGYVLAPKRIGKTEFVPCEFLCDAMLQTKATYIIQAQNDTKAKKVFRRISSAFYSLKRTMPYMYEYHTTKNEILFKKQVTNKSTTKKQTEEEFAVSNHVSIGSYPSKIDFIQGETVRGYFLDEGCSQEQMSLKDIHEKASAQCRKGISKIIGKEWHISTPENAESKALEYAEQMWNESDHTKRNKNGMTDSGLYRMLIPYYASDQEFVDEYGYPREEECKRYFINKYNSASEGSKPVLRRQYISDAGDCFQVINGGSLEPEVQEIYKNRLSELIDTKQPQPLYVISYYNKEVVLKPIATPTVDELPLTVEMFQRVQPDLIYRIGVDGTATDNNSSDGSNAGKSEFAIIVDVISGDDPYTDVANYVFRPENRTIAEKVAAWLAIYYNTYGNCKVYPERNAGVGSSLASLFINMGIEKLLIRRLREHNIEKMEEKAADGYGIYMDNNNKITRTSAMNRHGRLYGHRTKSIRLCKSMLIYGKSNADLADARGVSVLSFGNFDPETKSKPAPKLFISAKLVLKIEGGKYRLTV